jgi:hypothetical protein
VDALFLLLSLVVLVGGMVAMGRRRRAETSEARLQEEPWAASLRDDEDDEPLDEDEIRAAEDAFWEEGWDEPEDRGF